MLVPRRRFEQLVGEALDSLPAELLAETDNVAVLVADEPSPGQRAGHGDALLGLYEGVPLTQRSPLGTVELPDRITLFRRALCAVARDEEDLVEQIRVTLVHEFAHHVGIDDDRLDELGWA